MLPQLARIQAPKSCSATITLVLKTFSVS